MPPRADFAAGVRLPLGCAVGSTRRALLALAGALAIWAAAPASAAEKAFDYIVIGSGAGGAPVAARLAAEGFRVLVLEAGGQVAEPKDETARAATMSYFAPLLHAQATEWDETSWRYFVHHNRFDALDSKFDSEHDGLFYPRAATVGGCTAHHAMITLAACDNDWNYIASATGDSTWEAARMREYQRRVEDCRYGAGANGVLKPVGWLYQLLTSGTINPGRHGYDGWLPVTRSSLYLLAQDLPLGFSTWRTLLATRAEEKARGYPGAFAFWDFDPNDWRTMHRSPTGFVRIPLSIAGGERKGARERLLEVHAQHPANLEIWTHCLATRLLLEPDTGEAEAVARGVEFVSGEKLYDADPRAERDEAAAQVRRRAARPQRVYARREVIVSCGAFNTPQLLILSGIGPARELRRVEEDRGEPFPLKVIREGVGRNLQDRYEASLTVEEPKDWAMLNGLSIGTGRVWDGEHGRVVAAPPAAQGPDPARQSWLRHPGGVYGSNGGIAAVIWRSETLRRAALEEGRNPNETEPDLFMFSTPGWFRGYSVGWSTETLAQHNWLSWVILKAHTHSTGRVTLNARHPASPFLRPQIDFRNFHEGRLDDPDLEAIVDGLEYCQRMVQPEIARGACRFWPPEPKYPWEGRQGFAEYARREAWGHHASCTCPIGPDPRYLTASWMREHHYVPVLDSKFRVWGVRHLRVVDASVFPQIPGYFILLPIYMISEKAAQVIVEDAKPSEPAGAKESGALTARR